MDSTAQDPTLYESMIKLLIIGGPQVGKSSLVARFCNNTFSPSYAPTTGVHFKYKMLDFDSKKVKVQIWDTAGTDHSNPLLKIYYKKAMGILLVFSLSDKQSLEELEKWIQYLQSNANPNAIIILVGNKTDLSERGISPKEIKAFQKKYKVDKYVETSVKEGQNANEVFTELVKEVKERIEKGSFKSEETGLHALANQEKKPVEKQPEENKDKLNLERELKENEENMNKKVEELVEVAKKEMSFELEEIRKITRDELDARLQEEFEKLRKGLIENERKKEEENNKDLREELSFLRRAFESFSQSHAEEISQLMAKTDQAITNLVKENAALEERLSNMENKQPLREERDFLVNDEKEEGILGFAQKRKQRNPDTEIIEIDSNLHRSRSDKTGLEGSKRQKVREASFDKISRDPESTRNCSNSTEIFYAGGKKAMELNDRRVILDSINNPNAFLESERIWEECSPKKEIIDSAIPRFYNSGDEDASRTIEDLQYSVAVLTQEVKRMQARINSHEYGKHNKRHSRKMNKSCQFGAFGGSASEIGRLWETINSLVKNTHEEIDKVKEEVRRSKVKRIGEMKNVLVEKNVNGSIRELRDDIHDQLIEIQKDLEGKYGIFRNNLTMNYESFLKYFHTEQNKLRDFMEDRCFEIIEEALRTKDRPEEYHIFASKRSLSNENSPLCANVEEAKGVKAQALETLEEMKKKKSLALKMLNMEAQQKQMLSSYTNSFKSVWETIHMLADKVNGLDNRGSYMAEISRTGRMTNDFMDWRRMEF